MDPRRDVLEGNIRRRNVREMSCTHRPGGAYTGILRKREISRRYSNVTSALPELHWLPIRQRVGVQVVPTRSEDTNRSRTRLHLRPAHTSRRHAITLVVARLQQRQPLSSTDVVVIRRPCVLCRCTPCVESASDRTKTRALSTTTFKRHLKTFLFNSLTVECAMGLTVGGVLQMPLLLLLTSILH